MDLFTDDLEAALADIEAGCVACGGCAVRCFFLQEAGTPASIAAKVRELPPDQWPDPFHCSLCGLCGAVCPQDMRPERLFIAMRRAMVRADVVDFKPYKPVLNYERIGGSELFSLLSVPDGGDTVLFPGCALPATRPTTVRRLFRALQDEVPKLGVALGCCYKPSHDLGREEFFEKRFGDLLGKLEQAGVKRVITACPNCQRVFRDYGSGIEAVPSIRLLAKGGYQPVPLSGPPTVIHDPCPQRYDRETQQAVRDLAERCGMTLEKTATQGAATRCCGEGGAVKFVRPEFAMAWTEQRERMAKGRRVVTSCAGCVNFLGRSTETIHILDAMFQSRPRFKVMPPLTYTVRLWLKSWFKRVL